MPRLFFLIAFVPFLFLVEGCDLLIKTKQTIKNKLIGKPKNDSLSESSIAENQKMILSSVTPRGPTSADQSDQLVKVTPRTTLYHLCQGYIQTQEISLRKLFLKQAEQSASLLGEKNDEEIQSCLFNLLPLIEQKDNGALQMAISLYVNLSGENKINAEKVIGMALDFMPLSTLKYYHEETSDMNCSFALSLTDDIEPEKRADQLNLRKQLLSRMKKALDTNQVALSEMIDKCINKFQEGVPQSNLKEVSAENTIDAE